jgi:hypothetical protein
LWSDKKFADQAHIVADILGLSNAVEDAKKVSFDSLSFRCHLNTMIAEKLDTVSDDILLTLSYYLVKEYSEKNNDGLLFYNDWVESLNKRGKIL